MAASLILGVAHADNDESKDFWTTSLCLPSADTSGDGGIAQGEQIQA